MRLILLSLITLAGCVTTTTKTHLTIAYDCTDNDPYKDGACAARAAFLQYKDCLLFLSVVKNHNPTYAMCSIDKEEFK